MESKFFELPVGLSHNGDVLKDVELLETNGIAEKVFTKRIPEKPYTWQGNVVAIATKSIGHLEVGTQCREAYLRNNSVTLPPAVLGLTLADVNTMMVEIHRRCWESVIPKQEIICKYCTRRLVADINLDRIEMLPETLEHCEEIGFVYDEIPVALPTGFRPPVIPKLTDKEEYLGLTDIVFNAMTFRPPLLSDAIKSEGYATDSIGFWRRIAADCLVKVERVEDGEVTAMLPREFHTFYGLKLFNETLSGKDLKAIRTALTEHLPTLPFAYYEPCGCEMAMEIPMVMEASSFFSE